MRKIACLLPPEKWWLFVHTLNIAFMSGGIIFLLSIVGIYLFSVFDPYAYYYIGKPATMVIIVCEIFLIIYIRLLMQLFEYLRKKSFKCYR